MDLKSILLSDDVVCEIKNNMDYLCTEIPEIKNMVGFEHKHPHHNLDVWEHTLKALSLSEKDFDIRLCLLLHDIGKPFSCQDGQVRHFHGHALVSSQMSEKILKRLGFDEKYIEKICFLIKNHDTPFTEDDVKEDFERCLMLYKIQYCDGLAHNPLYHEKRKKQLQEEENLLKEGKHNGEY